MDGTQQSLWRIRPSEDKVAWLAVVMRLFASMGRRLFPVRRNPGLSDQMVKPSTNSRCLIAVRRIAERIWIWLGGGHVIGPATIGEGDHDCALASLYWAAPWLPERRIIEAFEVCTETWPYGGITNKEFQIALKYINVETHYSADTKTLGSLLDTQPDRCVALLPHHFIAIVDGKVVGRDAHLGWNRSTTVYCHWAFHS